MASPSRLPSMRRPGAPPSGRARPLSMVEARPLNTSSSNVPTSQTSTSTSIQSKRKSLLPQSARPGLAEDVRGEEQSSVRSTGDGIRDVSERPTPRSMPPPASRLTRPTSVYGVPGMGRGPTARTLPTPQEEEKPSMRSSAAGGTGLRRNVSVKGPAPPAANKGLSRTTSVRSAATHSRANSTSTIPSSAPSHKRAAMSVSGPRPPSQISGSTSPTSPASSTTSRQSATGRAHIPPTSRPAFSTYQQHYSPVKTSRPKPPVPTARTAQAASVTVEETSSNEMSLEQIELLQLSLLHQSSARTAREFEASARRKMGKKHSQLQNEYYAISDIEQEQKRVANLVALEAWCPDPILLAENLHVLSHVHSEICSLTDEDGRYTELVAVLEAWVEDAEGVFAGARVGFVERLPEVWRSTHSSLTLRLRALQRDLSTLPPPPQNENASSSSSIGRILPHCTSLVGEMMRELEVMIKLEREILQCEQNRLNQAVSALSLDDKSEASTRGGSWVPAWQQVS